MGYSWVWLLRRKLLALVPGLQKIKLYELGNLPLVAFPRREVCKSLDKKVGYRGNVKC